mgnify:CR=1 FL=1
MKINSYLKRVKFLLRRENKYIPSGYKSNNKFDCCPKVSVLLPIYNHADVAKYAIESILKQTYQNIELIILDDGSKDNLQEKIKKYYKHENVKIYLQKNQKLPRALTHLHQLATGDFITWTSADNIMAPEMIETLVQKLMMNPNAALVYGDVYVIDKNNKPYFGVCRDAERDFNKPNIIRLNRSDKPLSIGNDNYINASFLYRKENSDVLMGKYSDDIIGAEDYDYWLRLQKTGKLVHIRNKKPLYYYRVHDNSMSHELETKKLKKHQSRLENLQKYEQNRIKWCSKRPNIIFDVNDKKIDILDYILGLPVYINEKENDKNIYFVSKNAKEENVYYMVTDEYYLLKDTKKQRDIVKIFKGINVPRETYKSRNLYSHSFYQDELIRVKKPIFGCHINSNNFSENDLIEILKNNNDILFVMLDEISNNKIKTISENYNNFIYYPNKVFGVEYQTYSYFSRIISFKNDTDTNKYKNILLAYATGRFLNYCEEDLFYKKFPYTISYKDKINFYECDGISEDDYDVMDNYIKDYSKVGALKKCIRYFNGYTQEMFIERPKYDVDEIPPESNPIQIK